MSLLEHLVEAKRLSAYARLLEGRMPFPTKGIVVANNDPTKRRRIRASTANLGNQIPTNWLQPLRTNPHIDPPLPKLGQTVLILWADGDGEDGYYLVLQNDPNPPLTQTDPVLDNGQLIEGDDTVETKGNTTHTTHKTRNESSLEDYILHANRNLVITTQSGCTIELDENGNLTLQIGDSAIQMTSTAINITTPKLNYNGYEVATLQSTDSDGDKTIKNPF